MIGPRYDEIPPAIRRAQRRDAIARRVGELSIEVIAANDGADLKRIADQLRALADALEQGE
jgi:hypothetical protein